MRMMRVALLVLFLALSWTSWTCGAPADAAPVEEDTYVPTCHLGMDGDYYQCDLKDEKSYFGCKSKATRKCKCQEGLVCVRSVRKNEEEQTCYYSCDMENPKALGRKDPHDFDDSMKKFNE